MIICVAGTPGAGKTYDITKKIMDNLRLGRVVYTNIDGFDDSAIRQAQKVYCGLDDWDYETRMIFLDKEKSRYFWRFCKPGSLIVIDEIHKYFNSRDWQSPENREFVDWASTHRHEGFDLIMITQALEKVDKQARSLVEWTYFYRKVNYFGALIKNKFQMFSYIGDDDRGKAFAQKIKSYDNKIFKCYKSYVTEDVKEQGFMKHVNVLRHPVFFVLPVLVVLCLYLIFFKSSIGTGDIFGAKRARDTQQSLAEKRKLAEAPAVVSGSGVGVFGNVVEYKDLVAKKASVVYEAVEDVVGVSEVEASYSCRVTGTVFSDGDKFETLECPDGSRIKKKNGEVEWHHGKRSGLKAFK